MNVKKFLPLIAAAGLGLVALVIAHSGLGRSSGGDKGDKTIKVIVAKENIAPGQQLTADNVTEQSLAASTGTTTAYTRIDQVIGRITVAPMVAGQPVLPAFLAEPGALAGAPAVIPPGMRAITIDVTETTGVAGLVPPGAHVDLISVLNQGEHDRSCARTIAANVTVMAVGQSMSANTADANKGIPRTVTLLVKSKEAELIKLACLSANTSLALRGNGDVGPADSKGVMFSELTSGMPMGNHNAPVFAENTGPTSSPTPGPANPTTKPADLQMAMVPRRRTVMIILGDKVSTMSFDATPANTEGDGIDDENYTQTPTGYINH